MDGFFKGGELPLVQTESIIPKCGACGLYKTCRSPKMEPTGNGRRRVLIVAEAPGEDEDNQNRQLVGKSGKLFESILRKIGVDMRRDCWLTNAVICRPPNNEIKDDRVPEYCQPNLIKTINRLKPDVILAIGGIAVDSLVSRAWGVTREDVGAITRWAGWRIPTHKFNAWVCPTYHPAYLLRADNPVVNMLFERHLIQAFKLEGRPFDKVPDYASQIWCELDDDKAASFLNKIKRGTVAFDFECNMLKPESKRAVIVCCSVCWNGKETIAFPWRGKVQEAMRHLLRNPNVGKIASNMKYEHRWTKRVLGYDVQNWVWDTMLCSHVLDCRRSISSIKFQAFVQLGMPIWNRQIEPYLDSKVKGGSQVNKILKEIPLDKLLVYNGLDSLLEYLVAEKQQQTMRHERF